MAENDKIVKNWNETFWVIFKQCEIFLVKIQFWILVKQNLLGHPVKGMQFCWCYSLSISFSMQKTLKCKNVFFFSYFSLFLAQKHRRIHGVWKSQKKSHSTLRAKRATFTVWVDKSSSKMPKMVPFDEFFEKFKCDIFW